MLLINSAAARSRLAAIEIVSSSNSQGSFCPVFHHFLHLSSIDVVEITEDVHMRRCPGMGTNESRIPFQRRFIIFNVDTPSVIDIRDVDMLLTFISIDNAVGCEGSLTAIGMVHHHDVLNAKQMLRDVMERSASIARPPATITGKMVAVDATRLPEVSSITSPGKTSLPKSCAAALGMSAARGS